MPKYEIRKCACDQCTAGGSFRIGIYKNGELLVDFSSGDNQETFYLRFKWDGYANWRRVKIPKSDDEIIETFAELVRNTLVKFDH